MSPAAASWLFLASLVGAAPAAFGDQYYVVSRYQCVDVGTGEPKGTCEFRTDSKISCVAALQFQKQSLAARGDVCRICKPNDTSRQWDGNPGQFIQGGACQGMQ
jgi:hypothetical protein